MAEHKHKIKLELIRNNATIGFVIPDLNNNIDDLKYSSTSSIFEFPTANFESINSEVNQLFMSYSNSDIIRVSTSKITEDKYSTLFKGEFYSKKINFEKENNQLTLDVKAIHSFYRLAMLNLTSSQRYKKIKFNDFIYQLVQLAVIPSKVTIGEALGESLITGVSQHTNAFRLFKEVCILKGAIATFNSDNSVEIEYKKDKIMKIHNKPRITISDQDVISSEKTTRINN